MQEALKNPHYKKIWEKVIMNNNPMADSLEEAFKIEKGLCEYKVEVAWYGMNAGIPANSELPLLFDKLGAINEKTFFKTGKYGNNEYSYVGGTIFKKSINQYLGNPITLEDILAVLPRHSTDHGTNYSGFAIRVCKEVLNIWSDSGIFCFTWQSTKPLHEQTPETWEKIANLID